MGKRRHKNSRDPRVDQSSIGNLLLEGNHCTREQLESALEFQREHPEVLLGEYLVTQKIISREVLEMLVVKQLAARGQNSGLIKYAKMAIQRTRDVQVDLENMMVAEKLDN